MFGSSVTVAPFFSDFRDNTAVEVVGYSFTQHLDNEKLLRGSDRVLLRVLEQNSNLQTTYLQRLAGEDGEIVWRSSARKAYEDSVQRFLRHLAALFHLAAGQPLREPEFLSITCRNTQKRRSIMFMHKGVMIHTGYHKMQTLSGMHRDNVRFLPRALAVLLLDYLIYVRPLRQQFARSDNPTATLPAFLWEQGGVVWPAGTLSTLLKAACVRACVPALHIANWRQITVAIVKTKFASDLACFDVGDGDGLEEEIDEDVEMMTAQRNHTTRSANLAYANQAGAQFGNIWDGKVRRGQRASDLWHRFFALEDLFRERKRSRATDPDAGPVGRLQRLLESVQPRPRVPASDTALLTGLRKLYADPNAQWKTAAQQQAVQAVTSYKEEVVIVLPTGLGKSVLFMLPGVLENAGTTVLVLPLVALRIDLVRRCRELNLEFIEWTVGEERESKFVIVPIETAASNSFLKYAQRLQRQQQLDRIVFDECHLLVTAASYRPAMQQSRALRNLRTQFVYLTATLPPRMWKEFTDRACLTSPLVIRAACHRPNLCLQVARWTVQGGAINNAGALARREAERWTDPRDKIIVYTRTRGQAIQLAAELQSHFYVGGDDMTQDERESVLDEWINTSTNRYIVATSALAEGFDYAHVRSIINVGPPDDLATFAQQIGRAGRDGLPASTTILLPRQGRTRHEDNLLGTPDEVEIDRFRDGTRARRFEEAAVEAYLSGEICRRTALSDYLDLPPMRRWCLPTDVVCDVCKPLGETVSSRPAQPPPYQPPERASPDEPRPTRPAHFPLITNSRENDALPILNSRANDAHPDIPSGWAQPDENALRSGAQTVARLDVPAREPTAYQRSQLTAQNELEAYMSALVALSDVCLYCRASDQSWNHTFMECQHKANVFEAKKNAMDRGRAKGCPWIPRYTSCFWCFNSQLVCERAKGSKNRNVECRFPDMVLPLCRGVFQSPSGRDWLLSQFGREFTDLDAYFDWLGEKTSWADSDAVQAHRVAAAYIQAVVPRL